MNSGIREAINILEQFQDGLPRLEQDELESRLSDLENEGESLSEKIDALRQCEIHSLDDRINEVVGDAEDLTRGIRDLYSEV